MRGSAIWIEKIASGDRSGRLAGMPGTAIRHSHWYIGLDHQQAGRQEQCQYGRERQSAGY